MKAITTNESVENGKRPLVTFVLFAYNQERYIREALRGAFAQTYSPLEIVLSDDCSKDDTFDIMVSEAAAYQGPHRIILNRNDHNLNIGEHVNRVAEIAAGEFIVLAAGDDISVPLRTEKLVSRWQSRGYMPAALCSDFQPIDAKSQKVFFPKMKLYRGAHSKATMACGEILVLGATTAFSKDVWAKFPPMSSSIRHEDRVLPFRALLLGGTIELVDEKLVNYRVEGGVSTGNVLTAREYLFEYIPTLATRILPDAMQRLKDLDVMSPDDLGLRALCLKTLAEHESSISLSKAKGIGVEFAFFSALRDGARFGPLFRSYLRFRLFFMFSIYFRIKNS